ncbi:bifunctional metallophosphatase/5'-nucleotidase [Naumannella halotolerans]|uniref:2',3'-cyclic-nucleotide 2'-phosphodiesterase/3'-nucleotidase n=1 Tax=Naumannella halotolerans TaxID=993414 RepID=A0A4R7IYS1_9ACTN|nr:5'-nucleotidase C-terminal domain-containing protein [Naumannella halotolerans]TDT29845.1 2',3'-cyclic-nucleotide 2'-phosphodiesterase/3'-nucleotidase [Naumannella halotolerans]
MSSPHRRRAPRTAALAASAAALLLLAAPSTARADEAAEPIDLTLLATTDNHGHVLNWDYFADAPYPEGEELGLARLGTLINEVRQEKGEESVLLFDNGDAIQGTPLTYLYGYREPVTETGESHPMAAAFNALDYDAQVVGNHEYNYGLELLDSYAEQLEAPLLGANALVAGTEEPSRPPTTMIERTIDGQQVQIGVVGVVTPGVRYWDKAIVEDKIDFADQVETVQQYVPQLKAEGADVVVALAHTGLDPEGQTWDASARQENLATSLAENVPDLDVVVAGHTHQDIPETIVEKNDGGKTLITQPYYWGNSVSETSLHLVPSGDGFEVNWSDTPPTAVSLYAHGEVAEDPAVVAAVSQAHETTIDYVNTTIATSTEEMSGATSRYEDTALLDMVNQVQTETVREALAGTENADATVISQASPFNRDVVFDQGEVTIRDMAALYIYENTLLGVELTGAELKDYLEWSARYFVQLEEGATFDPETDTNAWDAEAGRAIPDYSYDVIDNLDYTINVSQPVGSRIEGLSHPDGTPVADDDTFVMAVNNYRQSGGSGYPHITDAPVVYDERLEIRQLLIDWAIETETIDPAEFRDENWEVVTSSPVTEPSTDPSGDPDPGPSGDPDPSPSGDPSTTRSPSAGTGTGTEDGGKLPPLADTGAGPLTALLLGIPLTVVGAALLRRRR